MPESYTIDVDRDAGVINVNYRGEITADDIQAAVERSWRLATDTRLFRFLNDFQRARVPLSGFDILSILEPWNTIGINKETRSAIVVSNFGQLLEYAQLHQSLAAAHTGNVKLFVDRDRAQEWLTLP
jgi:hypothetical protein